MRESLLSVILYPTSPNGITHARAKALVVGGAFSGACILATQGHLRDLQPYQ